MRFDHEVAVVTGASSGIGAGLARGLAAAGVKVGLTARRVDRLETLATQIRSDGGTAAVAPADAGDPHALREAITALSGELGPVDLLIANAGLGIRTSVSTFSADEFDQMIRVNLSGAAHSIEAVLPEMLRRRRGRIVGISSLAAYRGLPGSAGYCATKTGLTALLEAMRPELATHGVGVTTVHPGFVTTEMTAGADHPQPFLMDIDRASRIILKGIARGRRRIDFPWQMVALLGFVRALPTPLFDLLARRLVPPPTRRLPS